MHFIIFISKVFFGLLLSIIYFLWDDGHWGFYSGLKPPTGYRVSVVKGFTLASDLLTGSMRTKGDEMSSWCFRGHISGSFNNQRTPTHTCDTCGRIYWLTERNLPNNNRALQSMNEIKHFLQTESSECSVPWCESLFSLHVLWWKHASQAALCASGHPFVADHCCSNPNRAISSDGNQFVGLPMNWDIPDPVLCNPIRIPSRNTCSNDEPKHHAVVEVS